MRSITFFSLILSVALSAQITPNQATVFSGGSITLTSPTAVSWTLKGTGSLSTAGPSTTTIYTAPSSVAAQTNMLGCPVTPNDSVWTTRIDSLPISSHNATYLSVTGSAGFQFQPGWGVSLADNTTPTRTLNEYYGGNGAGTGSLITVPYSQFYNLSRESGNFAAVLNWGGTQPPDAHTLGVQRQICQFFELYNDAQNGYTYSCPVSGTCTVQSGLTYPWSNYALPSSSSTNVGTTAAGTQLAPLTLTENEMIEAQAGGSINHALEFTTAVGYVVTGSYYWPASSANGCAPAICPNAPPMGTRFKLLSSVSTSSICNSGVTREDNACTAVVNAIKQYGFFLVDIGSTNAFIVDQRINSDRVSQGALSLIQTASLPLDVSHFAVVDESSLEVSAASYSVCPNGSTCMGSSQTYQTPVNQAFITGGSSSVNIAIQPVTIGTSIPQNLTMVAGSYTFTFPVWTNPTTASQANTWSKTSDTCTGDSLNTSTGAYQPPPSLSGTSTCSFHLQAISNDPQASSNSLIDFFVTVIPSPSVGLSYSAGSQVLSSIPWINGPLPEGCVETYYDVSTGWANSGALNNIYDQGCQTDQGDLKQVLIVPNGNYDVNLLLGAQSGQAPTTYATYLGYGGYVQYSIGPYVLEAGGVIANHRYSIEDLIAYQRAYAAPVATIPVKVTNNILYAAVRDYTRDVSPTWVPQGGSHYKLIFMGGMSVTPDASAAHWVIDPQQQVTIGSSQTLLEFYVTDWFTGINNPTWSIITDPWGGSSTIVTQSDGGAIITAGSATIKAGQQMIIQATNGTYTATYTLITSGAGYYLF